MTDAQVLRAAESEVQGKALGTDGNKVGEIGEGTGQVEIQRGRKHAEERVLFRACIGPDVTDRDFVIGGVGSRPQ